MRAELALVLVLAACERAGAPAERAGRALAFEPLPALDPAAARGIEEARAALRAAPAAGSAWGELALRYQASDLLSQALDAYARAEELDPAEPRWPYYAGLALDRLGRGPEALAAWQRALERAREPYAPILWRMGFAWLSAFDLDRAESAFRAAIEAAPDEVAGRFGLARVLLARERFEEAADAVRAGLSRRPEAAYGHALLAEAERRLGRLEAAARELELAAGAPPLYPDPWEDELARRNAGSFQARFQQAATLFERGQRVESIAPLEALVREAPENRTVRKVLADAYSLTGRLDAADACFRALLADAPDDRQTLSAWAQHCLRNERAADARVALDALLARHPEDGQAHYLRGVLLEREERAADALAAYRRSLFLDQRNVGTLLAIGRLELALRRGPEARDAFEQARAAGAAGAELELGLGQALLQAGDRAGARAALERARSDPAAERRALERLERALARAEGAR